MIRAIALTLVMIVSANTGRVLACELACADRSRTPHSNACHEARDSGSTTLAGTPHDVCVADVTPPAVTMQKANGANQLVVFEAILASVSLKITAARARSSDMSRATDRSQAQRVAVLRV